MTGRFFGNLISFLGLFPSRALRCLQWEMDVDYLLIAKRVLHLTTWESTMAMLSVLSDDVSCW
jgi:hypothetical protein